MAPLVKIDPEEHPLNRGSDNKLPLTSVDFQASFPESSKQIFNKLGITNLTDLDLGSALTSSLTG